LFELSNSIYEKTIRLFLISFAVSAPLSAQTRRNGSAGAALAASKFGNVDSITGRQMKERLTFIASDELEGRDTPTIESRIRISQRCFAKSQ
jgi:hypothetical protein